MRSDVPPLPILELAPFRFESADPDEPFVLAAGPHRVHGHCRLTLAALRPAAVGAAAFQPAGGAAVRAIITPCGVVRSAEVAGVLVTERAAITPRHGCVFQWSVDRAAEIDLGEHGIHRMMPGQTATLLANEPLPDDLLRAFRAGAADITRAVGTGLRIRSPDDLGSALAWARARLLPYDPAPGALLLPLTLALLATGSHERARSCLEHAPPDLLPLLAARYAAWTGDPHSLQPLRARLHAATDAMAAGNDAASTVAAAAARVTPASASTVTSGEAAAAGELAAIRLAGLTELERNATDMGDLDYAAELRALAKHARQRAAQSTTPAASAMLTALGVTEPRTPITPDAFDTDVAFHCWVTWAALSQGLLASGLAGFERLLAEARSPVRGAWPRTFGEAGDDPAATALFVTTLVHGLLGIEPDAARNRLRVRPRIGALTGHLAADDITFGDATVSLRIERDDRSIHIRVAQQSGAIPATVLLEPHVAGRPRACWIDRTPAALDARARGDGVTVPVQLVLDDERSLIIELDTRATNA